MPIKEEEEFKIQLLPHRKHRVSPPMTEIYRLILCRVKIAHYVWQRNKYKNATNAQTFALVSVKSGGITNSALRN